MFCLKLMACRVDIIVRRNGSQCRIQIYIRIQTLTQYFVEAPLAVTIALSLLGYDPTSLAHLYLGSFSYCSLQKSQDMSGWMGSVAVQSGVWLGYSRTFRDLS